VTRTISTKNRSTIPLKEEYVLKHVPLNGASLNSDYNCRNHHHSNCNENHHRNKWNPEPAQFVSPRREFDDRKNQTNQEFDQADFESN
jgi:hypothetical protein